MHEHQTREVTLAVEGMHCEGCAEKLEARLGKSVGVREVEISFAECRARILYDPRATEEARLVDEIQKSGFRVTGKTDARGDGMSREALSAGGRSDAKRGWKSTLLSIPAILASLIPSITCPLCVTAYAALLSTLGLAGCGKTPAGHEFLGTDVVISGLGGELSG